MDFAEMLERMYLRWAAAKGFKATIIDRMPGDEAGIKSVDISVEGRFAYGYLKGVEEIVSVAIGTCPACGAPRACIYNETGAVSMAVM